MFKGLHALASRTALTLLITAEGDALRVQVFPKPRKGGVSIHPLSVTGSPEELDEHFVEAIETYQAPTMPLLEQAAAAAAKVSATPALPAPSKAAPAKATATAKSATKPAAKSPVGKKATAAKSSKAETKTAAAEKLAEQSPKNDSAPPAKSALNPAAAWPFPTGDRPAESQAQPVDFHTLPLPLDTEEDAASNPPPAVPAAVIEHTDLF